MDETQNLMQFLDDPVKDLNPLQLRHYHFLNDKIKQFKQLRKTAPDKNRVDKIIVIYGLEIKKLVEKK